MDFRKRQIGTYKAVVFLCLILSYSCISNSEHEKDYHYFIRNNLNNHCGISAMVFKEGETLFRIGLSGSCDSITMDTYCSEYEKMIHTYSDSLFNREGIIVLTYYNFNTTDSLLQKIRKITMSKTHKNIEIKEIWNKEGFILHVK